MPDYPIKLGMSMEEKFSSPEITKSDEEIVYPSLFFEWEKDYGLPKSGEMLVRFKKRSETNTERNGEKRQTVELEILEILDVKKKGRDDDDEEDEDRHKILDRLREEVEAEEDEE